MLQLKAPWNAAQRPLLAAEGGRLRRTLRPARGYRLSCGGGRARTEGGDADHPSHRPSAIRFLTLSLLVTPLMRGARSHPKLVAIRRMVGVAAFAYATTHPLTSCCRPAFCASARRLGDCAPLLSDASASSPGRSAALAATSTDAMIRRLGPRWREPLIRSSTASPRWRCCCIFMIQVKADVSEPVMMTGFSSS